MKVEFLALYFGFLHVLIMLVLAHCVVLVIVVCLYVGLILEGFFCVVLNVFLFILMYCIEGFSWGCIWHYSPLDREEVAMWGVGL